jgi:hypothetical protein
MLKQLKELSSKAELQLTISTEENGEMKVIVCIKAKDTKNNTLNVTPFIVTKPTDEIDEEFTLQLERLTSIVAPALDRMNLVLKSIEEATKALKPEKKETVAEKKKRETQEKKEKATADKLKSEGASLFDAKGNPKPGAKVPAEIKAEAKVSGTMHNATPEKPKDDKAAGKLEVRIMKLEKIGFIASGDKIELHNPNGDNITIDKLESLSDEIFEQVLTDATKAKIKDIATENAQEKIKEIVKESGIPADKVVIASSPKVKAAKEPSLLEQRIKRLNEIGWVSSQNGKALAHAGLTRTMLLGEFKDISDLMFNILIDNNKEDIKNSLPDNPNQASVDAMKATADVVIESIELVDIEEISEQEQMQIDSMSIAVDLDLEEEEVEEVIEELKIDATIELAKEVIEEVVVPAPQPPTPIPTPIPPAPMKVVADEVPVVNEIEEEEFSLELPSGPTTIEERFNGIMSNAAAYGINTKSLKLTGQTNESLDQLEKLLNLRIDVLNKQR